MHDQLASVLHYYSLYEDASTYKIICPFHDDINASMKIDLEANNFYCFGCHVSGDAYKFVKLMHKGFDDLQAAIRFQRILKSKKAISIKRRMVVKKVDNQQATTMAFDYYSGLSRTNWLKEKGEEALYLTKRGFERSTLNISKAKVNYNNSYPIIFPMFDNGDFKGWVCRTTNSDVEKKRKYLYNEGFSRRSTLVGDYKSDTVVIVEGYIDWLKLRQFGLKNVVAILGWKITSNQIEKLKDAGVKNIISALDNDACGKNGTNYLKGFFKVTPFYYPEGTKDPGEMTKEIFIICRRKTMLEFRGNKNGPVRRNQESSQEIRNKQR